MEELEDENNGSTHGEIHMSDITRLQQDLLAYYPLKGDANDYGGHKLNGTPSAQVKFSPGKWGSAADFTASGAYIILPYMGRYANQYTLSVWVNLKAYANIDPQASEWGTLFGRLAVSHTDGKLLFWFYYDHANIPDNQAIPLYSNGKISTDEWHHVLVTYDHSTRKLSFYIDGSLDVEHDLSGSVQPTDRPQLPTVFTIGGWFQASYAYASTLNGLVGDVFVFTVNVDQSGVDILAGDEVFPSLDDAEDKYNLKDHAQLLGFPFVLILIPVFIAIVAITVEMYWISQAQKQPSKPPKKSTQEIVDNIVAKVGIPATNDPNRFVGRSDINIDSSYYIHLDVGGEGHHTVGSVESGFDGAINLNTKGKDSQPPYGDIPLLVLLTGGLYWNPPPQYPFKERFADRITMQGTPLTDKNINEMTRCLRPGGLIELWIDSSFKPQIETLCWRLNSTPDYNSFDEFRGRAGYPKVKIVSNIRA
jgi:hypothetical protein